MDFTLTLGGAYAGLTDLRAQLLDTSGANVGTAISSGFTEIGTSSGRYLWHYTAFPTGHRGAVKFYSNAASSVILAVSAVNPEDGEYTISPTTLITNFWASITRTLTTPVLTPVSSIEASNMTITIGSTYEATLTGLTISALWTKIYLTIKLDVSRQTDALAVVQIQVTNGGAGSDGLIRLNGLTTTAAYGSLTVTQASGTVAISIADDATTSLLEHTSYYYDLKQLTSDGKSIVLGSGTCNIVPAVTLAIS